MTNHIIGDDGELLKDDIISSETYPEKSKEKRNRPRIVPPGETFCRTAGWLLIFGVISRLLPIWQILIPLLFFYSIVLSLITWPYSKTASIGFIFGLALLLLLSAVMRDPWLIPR